MSTLDALLVRIRAEFTEMPGLKLTPVQACRLWAADEPTCQAALQALEAEGFLVRTPSGAFIALPRPNGRTARALSDDRLATRCPHCRHLNSVGLDWRSGGARVTTTFRCSACSRVVNLSAESA